jgi:hypothetical protein
MNHSQTLQAKRKKQKNIKHLARIAKGAKKLRNQNAAMADAPAAKVE